MSHSSIHLRVGSRGRAAAVALVVATAAAALLPAVAHAATKRSHHHPTLAEGIGMRAHPSVRVRKLQRALVRHGYSVGPSGVDGRFGPRTRKAVRRAQRRHHLKVDGVAGQRTLRALGVGARSRARASHHRASTSHSSPAHRPAIAAPAAAVSPSAAAPRPAPASRPAPLSTDQSSSAALAVVPVVAIIAILFALAYRRRRRKHMARIAAYHLPTVPRPPLKPAEASPPLEAPQPAPPTARSAPAAASARGLAPGAAVIGYVAEPSTLGAHTQRAPEHDIERACGRAGWELVDIVRDQEEAQILERPGLSRALERIAEGEARALVVNDARRLSRSVDFAKFVQWFRDAGASLIALDLGLDTSTPEGGRVASALVTLNGWAGAWINSSTRRSLADLRPAEAATRRLAVEERPEVLGRVAEMADGGMSVEEIADQLNEEGVPTLFGTERWWPSSVQSGLRYWRAGARQHDDTVSKAERSTTA
jgi:DNA invertase Pin-like site-specific DNA recombinase